MKKVAVLGLLVFALLASSAYGQLPVDQNGNPFPMASGIAVVSPFRFAAYTTNLITLNVSQTVMAAGNIQYTVTYSLDGKANASVPLTLRPAYEGAMFQRALSGTINLPPLADGLHTITVYERIDVTTNPAQFATASDTVHFTVDRNALPPNPPVISTLSVENKTYGGARLSFSFALNETVSWIGYSLDGQTNRTVAGYYDPNIWGRLFDASLTGLSVGSHSLTVYASGASGAIGSSETIFFTVAENFWVQKAPMPTGRHNFGLAAFNGKLYAIGGYKMQQNGNEFYSNVTNVNEMYDPVADTWTEMAPMPTARGDFAIVAHYNKIYCIGGAVVNAARTIPMDCNEVYDILSNTWETRSPMPTARIGIEANIVEDKIYVMGDGSTNEVYNPGNNTWTTKKPLPTSVHGATSAVIDNKIYVISGTTDRALGYTNVNQIYDPASDNWSLGAPIPMPVSNAAAAATKQTGVLKAIYVLGGTNQTSPLNGHANNQVYFPQNDSWGVGNPMPKDKAGLSVAAVNDILYAVGGGHNIFTPDSTDNMQYTPFGIGAPNQAAPAQTVSPAPSTTPKPTPNSPTNVPIFADTTAPEPTTTPSPSQTIQYPATSPNQPAIQNLPQEFALGMGFVSAVALTAAVLLVFRKSKPKFAPKLVN